MIIAIYIQCPTTSYKNWQCRLISFFSKFSNFFFFFLSTEYLQLPTTPMYVTCMSHVCIGQSLQIPYNSHTVPYKSLQLTYSALQLSTVPYNWYTNDIQLTYMYLHNLQSFVCNIQKHIKTYRNIQKHTNLCMAPTKLCMFTS